MESQVRQFDGDELPPKEQVIDRPPKRISELEFGVLYDCLNAPSPRPRR